MAHIVDTMHLFMSEREREQKIRRILQPHFQHVTPQQILYELKRYGLDIEDAAVPFDPNWWPMLSEWATTLQNEWGGPNMTAYLLPAKMVNAVCFQRCICLFARAPMYDCTLQALLTHEYNHSCRLARFGLPETVEDYIVLEGLAQWAVRELHGVEALKTWATQLTLEETLEIWAQVDMDSILDVYAVLFGEEAAFIPSHFGYSLGYRLIEQFVEKNDGTVKELLTLQTNLFWQ